MAVDSQPDLASTIIQSIMGAGIKQQEAVTSPFKKDKEPQLLERLSSSLNESFSHPRKIQFREAAGLTRDISGLNVAKRNLGEGVSMLQTADSGLEQIEKNLQRIGELAQKAMDPYLTQEGRQSLQVEVDELTQQIQKITENTEYKGLQLLSTDALSTTLQIGHNDSRSSRFTIGLDQGLMGRITAAENQTSNSSGSSTTGDSGTTTDSGSTDGSTATGDTGTGTGSDGTTDTGTNGDGSTDTGTGTDTTTDSGSTTTTTETVALSELETNQQLADALGWEVDGSGEIKVGQATADALNSLWTDLVGRSGNQTAGLAERLDLDAATEGEVNHQYISETINVNGKDVEYSFKVSFTVSTNGSGEKQLDEVMPTLSYEEEWQNGSPISVTYGDQQLAVVFNRNLNRNQQQGYDYLGGEQKGGFQNFGVLTPNYEPVTVDNVQEVASEPTTGGDTSTGDSGSTDTSGDGTTGGGDTGGTDTSSDGTNTGSQDSNTDTTTGAGFLKSILTSETNASQPAQVTSVAAAQTTLEGSREAQEFISSVREDLEGAIQELNGVMAGNQRYNDVLNEKSNRIQDTLTAEQMSARAQEQLLQNTELAALGLTHTDQRSVVSLLKDEERSAKELPYSFPPEKDDEKAAPATKAASLEEDEETPDYSAQAVTATEESSNPWLQAEEESSTSPFGQLAPSEEEKDKMLASLIQQDEDEEDQLQKDEEDQDSPATSRVTDASQASLYAPSDLGQLVYG
ncbi:flagellin [Marinospirillum perlucidum]|uniref:flagellin n=1 Tax=Marinospirillum perlucidum TaxID=1982602 RepID=UPI000DF25588|nr:flagellin [Marinospirillum perlucidum]